MPFPSTTLYPSATLYPGLGDNPAPEANLDVITLAEAKRAVNIAAANTDHDDEIASYVRAVSLAMDKIFGPIVQRQVTETHDGGSGMVFLRALPVATVATVVERSASTATTLGAEDFEAPTGDDYQFDASIGILSRRRGGWDSRFAQGSQNVLVTYVAGRFTNTASVDARFKQGAAIMFSHLWRPEQGLVTGAFSQEGGPMPLTFAVPRAVLQLLDDERSGSRSLGFA